jgi:hypothetical protein
VTTIEGQLVMLDRESGVIIKKVNIAGNVETQVSLNKGANEGGHTLRTFRLAVLGESLIYSSDHG